MGWRTDARLGLTTSRLVGWRVATRARGLLYFSTHHPKERHWYLQMLGTDPDWQGRGVGSAIMAPQVFEKSLSCVNNLRLQDRRPIVHDHAIYVVDIQDGGNWDWSKGEPPKTNPAYYLRFCKSFDRMGGAMRYLQIDNVAFLHHLLRELAP